MKHRKITKLLAAVMSLSMIASSAVCVNAAETEKTDLTVWFCLSDNMDKYVDEGFVERFEAAYPQYNLTAEIIPGTAADFETKYNAAKMSGTLPDVAYMTLTSFSALGTRGEFLPLDDYISSWESKDDIMPAALNMGLLGDGYGGVGVSPAPVALMYRADMFEAAGLDPEAPPTNWEELAEYAEKLTIKDDSGNIVQGGLDIPTIDAFMNFSAPMMLMNGATVVDEAAREPRLTDPEVIETLEYIYSIFEKGVSLPHDWQKAETVPFQNGISAMSFVGTDRYIKMLENNPDLEGKLRLASPVSNKKAAAFCGYRLMTLPVDSKNHDAAWDVLDFFMSEEEMKIRVETCSAIPVRTSLEQSYVDLNPEIGAKVLENVAVGKGAFVVPWVATLYKYYGPAYESIMQGIASPADAMATAQEGLLAEIG